MRRPEAIYIPTPRDLAIREAVIKLRQTKGDLSAPDEVKNKFSGHKLTVDNTYNLAKTAAEALLADFEVKLLDMLEDAGLFDDPVQKAVFKLTTRPRKKRRS